MHLSEIARVVAIDVRRDGEFESLGLLSHAQSKLLVVFYDPKYAGEFLGNPRISAVITSPQLAEIVPDRIGLAVSADPMAAFYAIHEHLATATEFYGSIEPSRISPDARIHPRAYVAERGVVIGPGCDIGPGAIILERSTLEADVVLGPNVMVGGEGFEPKFVAGRHVVVRHSGGVQLGRGVEIQAGTHVARSVFGGLTSLGDGVKVDALVYIAHNVTIGRNCEIAGCAMIAGSTTIGDDVWVGPNASISSGVTIGDHAFVAIGALVLKDVAAGAVVVGAPCRVLRWKEGYGPPPENPGE